MIFPCGQVSIGYGIIQVIGSLAKELWCPGCNTWHAVWREATAYERAGLVIPPKLDSPIAPF